MGLSENSLVHEFHRSISWSGETTVADTCYAILKGEPTHTNHKEGEAGILGPHGDHAGHHPSRGMLGLKEAIFDEDNHFKGKDEDLMHTQKTCQCTICDQNFQKARSLNVR